MNASDSASDLKRQATAISDGIAGMHREHYGRGADRTRTLIHQDVVMTRLEDCFTTVERKMITEGAFRAGARDADDVPGLDAAELHEIVEDATGRRVAAFFSQVTHDPDMALEVFLLGAGFSSGDDASRVDRASGAA